MDGGSGRARVRPSGPARQSSSTSTGGGMDETQRPGEQGGNNPGSGSGPGGSNGGQSNATGTGNSTQTATGTGQETVNRQQPLPQPAAQVPVKDKSRVTSTRTRTRTTFRTLSVEGGRKLFVFVTAIPATFWGWSKGQPDEINALAETFVDALEPYPYLSHMFATFAAPFLFGGAVLLYVGNNRAGNIQPMGNNNPPPPAQTLARPTLVPPPPPPIPQAPAAQVPTPPVTVATAPPPSTNGVMPIDPNTKDSGGFSSKGPPILTIFDN